MIRSGDERAYYRILSRIGRIIETRFSQLEEFEAKFIKAISRRSQNNPIHTIPQHIPNDGENLMGTRVFNLITLLHNPNFKNACFSKNS
jgi:hypothetical protein